MSNGVRVIRHKPTHMALTGVAFACAFLLVRWSFWPPRHSAGQMWFFETTYAAICAICLYNIAIHWRGPIRETSFVRSIGSRNLWIVKGSLIAVMSVFAIAVLINSHHR